MRIIFFLVFIFCFQSFALAQNNIDVLHYRYEIKLNDNNDTIYGKAEITATLPKETKGCEFDLTELSKGKGMMIDTIKINRKGVITVLPMLDIKPAPSFRQINGKVFIDFFGYKRETPIQYNLKDTVILNIYYRGIPADGLIISKTKYGHRSFFADNWPNRGHNWIPCHDDPADKATVEFIVTAPEHYQVVANGVQIEETSLGNGFKLTHWKEDTPISTKVMVIGAADFAVNLAGVVNGIFLFIVGYIRKIKTKAFMIMHRQMHTGILYQSCWPLWL
jgi:hypothetical protein